MLTAILIHSSANAAFNYLPILPEFTQNMDRFWYLILYLAIFLAIVYFHGRKKDDFVVSIIDHGIGMDDEEVEKIFDKFYRANTNGSVVGGLGLGMYIVKNIIDAHGGNVSVCSKKDHGTTVAFSIPCGLLKRP